MGMSFATLSLYGAERSALEAALAPGDLLRDRNLPWLTLVPAQEEEGDFPLRLEKAARRLTKGSDAVALLFYYYDDDAFVCRLYQKRSAGRLLSQRRILGKAGKTARRAVRRHIRLQSVPLCFALQLSGREARAAGGDRRRGAVRCAGRGRAARRFRAAMPRCAR